MLKLKTKKSFLYWTEKAPDGRTRSTVPVKYRLTGVMDAPCPLVWDGTSPDPMGDTIKDGSYVCFAKVSRGAMDSLKAGVTTVRDVDHDDASIPLARSTVELSQIIIFSLLRKHHQGSYGHCPMIGLSQIRAQLIDRIKRLKGYDVEMSIPPVHWAKIMASGGLPGLEDVGQCMYSPKELETLVYEAHHLNMKVAPMRSPINAISKCVDWHRYDRARR